MSLMHPSSPSLGASAALVPASGIGVDDLADRRLRGSPFLALRNVSCEYHEGVLTLRGCLPTYYLKQVAQEAVAAVEGVTKIANCIEVAAPIRRQPA